jgi:hypothetical protein
MHFVQETGYPLHFINNHPPVGFERTEFVGEMARIHQQSLVGILGQQVDHVRIGIGSPEPCALSGATWSHKKKTLFRSFEYSGQHNLTIMMSFYCVK